MVKHSYILQPVTGDATYSKLRRKESANSDQPLQKAVVNLNDVTLSLSKVFPGIKSSLIFFWETGSVARH